MAVFLCILTHQLQVEAELKKKAEKERNLLDQKFADLRHLMILGGAGERALLLDMQRILEGTQEHGECYMENMKILNIICIIPRNSIPSCSNALNVCLQSIIQISVV